MPRGLLPQYGKKIYGTYTHMQVLSALLSVLYDLHNSKKLKYNKTKRDSIESNNLSENASYSSKDASYLFGLYLSLPHFFS